jgi:hypothetical protein
MPFSAVLFCLLCGTHAEMPLPRRRRGRPGRVVEMPCGRVVFLSNARASALTPRSCDRQSGTLIPLPALSAPPDTAQAPELAQLLSPPAHKHGVYVNTYVPVVVGLIPSLTKRHQSDKTATTLVSSHRPKRQNGKRGDVHNATSGCLNKAGGGEKVKLCDWYGDGG